MTNYYLGLDVGTNSVGWAVTDEKYNLIKAPVKGKYKNHDMWGIRLFESAETAEGRRTNRSMRRRLQRRKNRINLLQDIFKDEIQKVDETFFIRLNESMLHEKDKTTESVHPLFSDEGYTDKEYFEEYPTIFHLRKALIYSTEEQDIRKVYLALHNIIKYRGNFLIEGEMSADEQKSIHNAFGKLVDVFATYGLEVFCSEDDLKLVEELILDRKISKSEKAKVLKEYLEVKPNGEAMDYDSKKAEKALAVLMVGNKGNIKDVFQQLNDEEIDEETTKLFPVKFSEAK